MSRIGKIPVPIPAGVKVTPGVDDFLVEGKHGKLRFPLFPEIAIRVEGGEARVENRAPAANRKARALHGRVRAYLANMVRGVAEPWTRRLRIEGVGYNAKIQGSKLVLQIGFSHPVELPFPEGVVVECPSATEMVVKGIDRHSVGQFAANIRRVRPPEPYKGKGIRYVGEVVRRKAGKSLTSGK